MTQDDAGSAPMRGSHGPVSASVHVDKSACGLPYSRPLRRALPTLTDAEREAIREAIMECESMPTTRSREAAATLRALLARLG